jgi:hypothetical protein
MCTANAVAALLVIGVVRVIEEQITTLRPYNAGYTGAQFFEKPCGDYHPVYQTVWSAPSSWSRKCLRLRRTSAVGGFPADTGVWLTVRMAALLIPCRWQLRGIPIAAGRDLRVHLASPVQAGIEERLGTRVDGSAGVQVGSGNVQVNNYYDGKAAGAARAVFPARFTQRAVTLHDGLRAGTMLAIEIGPITSLSRPLSS